MNLIVILMLLIGVTAGTFDKCPETGDATGARTKGLNILKNRATNPPTVNPAVTLAAMLAPLDDRKRWKDSDGAELTGWVQRVTSGGSESCNCHKTDPVHLDTHIALTLNKGDRRDQTIHVEVSPRWRAAQKMAGVDWSTVKLAKLVGHRVTVRGWLMLDLEHVSESNNTHRGSGNWRASAWELHPVTDIRIEE